MHAFQHLRSSDVTGVRASRVTRMRASTAARRGAARILRAPGALALVALVGLVASSLLGGPARTALIAGDSMLPTYEPGELVVTWRQRPRVGAGRDAATVDLDEGVIELARLFEVHNLSAAEVAERLEAVLAGRPVSSRFDGSTERGRSCAGAFPAGDRATVLRWRHRVPTRRSPRRGSGRGLR